ncbi:MAG: hypothetical protein JWM86_380 [Thermoleophilia bacterium]|nr:hypothetical protein [Thermoleophilia bacterium]
MQPTDPLQDPDINPMADPKPSATPPDAVTAHLDPSGLKDALGRTGRMLKTAGLPFEDEEFDDERLAEAGTPDATGQDEDEDEGSSSS